MNLRHRLYLSEEKHGEKPKNIIKKKSQIDSKKRYMIWEKIHGKWLTDRSFYGTYFKGEGEYFLKSSKHAVTLA